MKENFVLSAHLYVQFSLQRPKRNEFPKLINFCKFSPKWKQRDKNKLRSQWVGGVNLLSQDIHITKVVLCTFWVQKICFLLSWSLTYDLNSMRWLNLTKTQLKWQLDFGDMCRCSNIMLNRNSFKVLSGTGECEYYFFR